MEHLHPRPRRQLRPPCWRQRLGKASAVSAGFRLMAYTVNDLPRARELLGWGVDAICTDRIDLIGPDLKA